MMELNMPNATARRTINREFQSVASKKRSNVFCCSGRFNGVVDCDGSLSS